MVEIIFSPKWFYGKDIVIDIVAIIVLLLIAFFSFKYYWLDKKKGNYLLLSSSFFLIALSFVSKIITNFTIYYDVLEQKNIGLLTLTYPVTKYTNALFFFGFLMYRVFTLIGLYLLYSVYFKRQPKTNMMIISYLIVVLMVFTQKAYYIFHFTALMLLVILTYQYFVHYKMNKLLTTRVLAYSFLIIAVSQILFIFVKANELFYVAAEILQLLGYILLLVTFIMVLKHGKKKK